MCISISSGIGMMWEYMDGMWIERVQARIQTVALVISMQSQHLSFVSCTDPRWQQSISKKCAKCSYIHLDPRLSSSILCIWFFTNHLASKVSQPPEVMWHGLCVDDMCQVLCPKQQYIYILLSQKSFMFNSAFGNPLSINTLFSHFCKSVCMIFWVWEIFIGPVSCRNFRLQTKTYGFNPYAHRSRAPCPWTVCLMSIYCWLVHR